MRLCERLTLLVLAVVCLITASAWSAEPVKIGASIGPTGRYTPMGQMYASGLFPRGKRQNAKDGILGRPVDLIIHDDRSDPETAVKTYREMLSNGMFDFVFGRFSSPVSEAVAPVLEEYGYPRLMPMTTVETAWDAGPRYVFGVSTPERRWTKAIVMLMAKSYVNRLVILVNESLRRLGSPREARKWPGRLGLTILSLETVDIPGVDEQFLRARDADAQALLVWGYFDHVVAVRRALAKGRWTPRLFFSQVGPSLEEYARILGELANYSLGCGIWEPEMGRDFPGGMEFLESLCQEYKRDPSYHAANGHAAGVILAEAIARGSNGSREGLRHVV